MSHSRRPSSTPDSASDSTPDASKLELIKLSTLKREQIEELKVFYGIKDGTDHELKVKMFTVMSTGVEQESTVKAPQAKNQL